MILIGAILIVPFVYNLKKESADGRLFVWKVAIEKIHENPFGYGYGMVQGIYNKAQAREFENNTTTENEKTNAEYMSTLNNDYLEILLQGGVIGIIAYLSFFTLIFIYSYNTINFFELLGVLSFLVMSCFCFALYSPQVVFVLAIYLSFIKTKKKDLKLPKALNYSILTISIIMIFIVIGQIYTQIKIREIANCIKKNKIATAKIIANDYFMFASTSELYNRTIADIYYFEKDFKTASNYYEKAIYYAPFPEVLSRLSYCEMKLGYYKKAEQLLNFSANIQPSSFEPYKNLMIFYSHIGHNNEAKKMAYYILQKKPKRISNNVLKCRHLANIFIKSN
jgi:tetratricopeptide (TPR) repeat protein